MGEYLITELLKQWLNTVVKFVECQTRHQWVDTQWCILEQDTLSRKPSTGLTQKKRPNMTEKNVVLDIEHQLEWLSGSISLKAYSKLYHSYFGSIFYFFVCLFHTSLASGYIRPNVRIYALERISHRTTNVTYR